MSYFNKEQIDKIVALAFEAGKIAISNFENKNFTITKKTDKSQVTSADIEISNFFNKNLSQEFPNITIICEEGKVRSLNSDEFFLIDPIDGTSSFASNSCEFAINIAFVKDKKPVFGLIYAPLFEGGKMIYSDAENKVIFLQNILTKTYKTTAANRNSVKNKSLQIITSSRTKIENITNYISYIFPEFIDNFKIERLSSAVKFFRLIENQNNVYLHFRPSMEWDTASGHFLIELIGVDLKKLNIFEDKILENEDFLYQKDNFLNGPFVAKLFK